MNKVKHITALVLALMMTLMLFPTGAMAANVAVDVKIEVEKIIRGDRPRHGIDFTFTLTPEETSNPMPKDAKGNAVDTLVINGEGTGSFDAITFTAPGNYTYTIVEVDGKVNRYTYDKAKYTITVYVTTDDSGVLSASVRIFDEAGEKVSTAKVTFTNRYRIPDDPWPTASPKPTVKPVKPHTPGTGDTTNNTLWYVLLAVSVLGMAAMAAVMSKKKKKSSDDGK